jgi:hypothetical protein
MAGVPEEPVYEFDVAVSFASEDREFVEEIVDRLKDADVRVFYDTDYQAAMWGEDLIDYLDQVYRLKARYAIIFISRFYAEKMWTRHERRSALARALQQRSAYVLPVRLDSTALEGLRPTLGYLDARLVGPDGIVSATLAKLTGTPPAQPVAPTRVPRTEAERQQVLLIRPPAWEYLYFAGQLLHERNGIESTYRDHKIHYARSTGEIVKSADILSYLTRMSDDAQRIVSRLSMLINDEAARERAFGAPGQAGDPDMIAHLAMRWNSAYEGLFDWSAGLRGASAPSEYHYLLELLARYMDTPIEQYRGFVDDFVEKVDTIPAAIAAGNPVVLEMSIVVSIPDEVTTPFMTELERLESQLKRDIARSQ